MKAPGPTVRDPMPGDAEAVERGFRNLALVVLAIALLAAVVVTLVAWLS